MSVTVRKKMIDRKGGKKVDAIWQEFEAGEPRTRATCKLCKKEMSGLPYRMKKHFKICAKSFGYDNIPDYPMIYTEKKDLRITGVQGEVEECNLIEIKEEDPDSYPSSLENGDPLATETVDNDVPSESKNSSPIDVTEMKKIGKYFYCDLCDYKTDLRGSLKKHVGGIHLKLKPHSCSLCDYRASQNKDIKRHIQSVHLNLKPFECSECDYSSNRKNYLKRHIENVHLGIKAFKCPFCTYETNFKETFNQHLSGVHLEIKEFICSECEFKTHSKYSLKNHVKRVHLKIGKTSKKIHCSLCNHRSLSERCMAEHVNTMHLKLKIFECLSCEFKTHTKWCLKNHIDKIHQKMSLESKSERDIPNFTS